MNVSVPISKPLEKLHSANIVRFACLQIVCCCNVINRDIVLGELLLVANTKHTVCG